MLAMVIAAIVLVSRQLGHEASANTRQANVEKGVSGSFYPTPGQWASLTVEPVVTETFREELVTEGKIAVDEDHATAIYSPYTGRVTKLLVAPGDKVNGGQPLFVLEAANSVLIIADFENCLGIRPLSGAKRRAADMLGFSVCPQAYMPTRPVVPTC